MSKTDGFLRFFLVGCAPLFCDFGAQICPDDLFCYIWPFARLSRCFFLDVPKALSQVTKGKAVPMCPEMVLEGFQRGLKPTFWFQRGFRGLRNVCMIRLNHMAARNWMKSIEASSDGFKAISEGSETLPLKEDSKMFV